MSSSLAQVWRKEKPTARSLLAVGSGVFLKSALLHPIPSSRRHVVIRVDIPVPVDVIRVAFWMRVSIKMVNSDNYNNGKIRVPGGAVQGKFKIPIEAIRFSGSSMWGQPPSAVRRAQLDVR
jgi:hypothetical protein